MCGGAFEGLDALVSRRTGRGARIGFSSETGVDGVDNPLHEVISDDLLKYGLIPEFVGRLPVVAALDQLDKDALKRILTEPRNALVRQYNGCWDLMRSSFTLPTELSTPSPKRRWKPRRAQGVFAP